MSIRERIQEVFILQKFVRMSRYLLPAYVDLLEKESLTTKEKNRLRKINVVYGAFKASSETSLRLINSNIVELIKSLYTLSRVNKNIKRSEAYKDFILESDGLIRQWNKQILN